MIRSCSLYHSAFVSWLITKGKSLLLLLFRPLEKLLESKVQGLKNTYLAGNSYPAITCLFKVLTNVPDLKRFAKCFLWCSPLIEEHYSLLISSFNRRWILIWCSQIHLTTQDHSFITWIFIAPLQGYYSEALLILAWLKRTFFRLE